MSKESTWKTIARENSLSRINAAKIELEEVLKRIVSPLAARHIKFAISNIGRWHDNRRPAYKPSKEYKEKKNIKSKKRNSKSRDTSVSHRQRWTDSQDSMLINSALNDADLAVFLGRTIFAIQNRRHVLAKTTKTPA